MATTKRGFIFASFVLSCIALVQIIVAFSTEMWVSSQLVNTDPLDPPGSMNAGVFKGSSSKGPLSFDVTIVCDFGENVCMWSCMATAKGRQKDLENLLQGKFAGSCLPEPSGTTTFNETNRDAFMNAGAWLSAVVALALTLIATAGAAFLGVLNTAANPSKVWLAIDSLYFWNGAAALLDIMGLVLLGVIYGNTHKSSVSVDSVIVGVHASDASLGWSYWLLVDPPVLHLANIGLLVYRDWAISREPPEPEYDPQREKTDGTIFLY